MGNSNNQNKQNTLDFIQCVIDQAYVNASYDKQKSFSYNQGVQYAALRNMEQELYEKTIKELQKQ